MTRTLEPAAGPARQRHPVRWIALTLGVILVGGLGTAFGLRIGRDPQPVDTPLLGKAAPAFNLPGLADGRVRLADHLTGPVVINFWASWCVPCREEAPRLEDFHERHADEGVTVIGIVWNDTGAAARAFRDEFGLTFPQAIDTKSEAALDYGVRGVPETYIIGPDGTIMAKVIGAIGPRTLDDLLVDVLAGNTSSTRNDDDYQTDPPG